MPELDKGIQYLLTDKDNGDISEDTETFADALLRLYQYVHLVYGIAKYPGVHLCCERTDQG
ncbi:MAG: hypothetical protein LUE93_06455 [Bacteroides sp.]|nr:hypothetical protein [Bacteroides sp.]